MTILTALFLQLADAKKKLDEDQAEMEAQQAAKRKVDKELEAVREQLESAQADAQKALKSKKKLQEEVCALTNLLLNKHCYHCM